MRILHLTLGTNDEINVGPARNVALQCLLEVADRFAKVDHKGLIAALKLGPHLGADVHRIGMNYTRRSRQAAQGQGTGARLRLAVARSQQPEEANGGREV